MRQTIGLAIAGIILSATTAMAQDSGDEPVTEAPQNWSVCNDTSFVLKAAVASPVNGQMTPRGWIRIRPGECEETDITIDVERFIYAESSAAHQGGIREWKGGVTLCAKDEDFTADVNTACAIQGMETRPYKQVSPDEPVTRLVEAQNYGKKAGTAGLQRLLKDNGYDISRIDGLAGRRTSNTLKAFLTDNELSNDLSSGEHIDILEETAFNFVDQVGLTICNSSSRSIWTAVAYRHKGNWQSEGWWSVNPDECGQAYRQTLSGSELHMFALQEAELDETGNPAGNDSHLISNSPQPAQFCIAESRFKALGRENCADFGYDIADFRGVPTDESGYKISLTDSDFAAPNVSGLRR